MAGRPYTMREMRAIVDYLKETNAYGEIKGRKMWMDYEQTKKTSRTWQSMKETFLKRILPDIHNPYYKLTTEEIASFRVGYSMIKSKHTNKLEVKVNKSDPKSLGHSKQDRNTNNAIINVNKSDIAEQKSKAKEDNNGIENSGENKKSVKITSKHDHEPIVLNNNFYESSQDIINDLLSSNEEDNIEKDNNSKLTSPKNTKICHQKDFISYSEPLLPIIKQIVNDFDSDDTDCSTELDKTDKGENNGNNHNVIPIVKNSIEGTVSKTDKNRNEKIKENNNNDSEKRKLKTGIQENKKMNTRSCKNNNNISKELVIKDNNNSHISLQKSKMDSADRQASSVISSSNEKASQNTYDDSLPNNQEGLQKRESKRLQSSSSDKNLHYKKDIEPTTSKDTTIQHAGNEYENRKSNRKKSDVGNKKIFQDKDAYHSEDKQLSVLNGNSDRDNSNSENKNDKNKHTSSDNDNSENGRKTTSLPNNQEGLQRRESKRLQSSSSDKSPHYRKDINSTTSNDTVQHAGNKDENHKSNRKKSDVENKKISKDKDAYDLENKQSSVLNGNSDKDNSKGENKKDKNKHTSSDNINLQTTSQTEDTTNHEKVDDNTHKNKINNVPEISKYQSDSSKSSNNNNLNEQLSVNLHLVDRNNKEATANKINVLLQSNSSDSSTSDAETMLRKENQLDKNQALSKLFGFSNDGPRSCAYNRKITYPHMSRHQRRGNILELSDWTSDNDSDFIPPPRNRKSRTRYLKPGEARIMNLDNDGGALVTYMNKVYPVIAHGTAKCKFLKMKTPNDVEDDGLFWKEKYIAERKRYNELTRLVDSTKNKKRKIYSPVENETFVISDDEGSNRGGLCAQDNVVATTQNDVNKHHTNYNKEDGKTTVTIKNIQTNQEITLEGKWPDIEPIFNRVLKVLPQEAPVGVDARSDKGDKRKCIENVAALVNASTSGNCNGTGGESIKPAIKVTPPSPTKNVNNIAEQISDLEVKKKIDEVESAIFKEIEEIDKSMNEERVDETTKKVESLESKVNTRKRGRRAKNETSSRSGSGNSVSKRDSGTKRDSDSEIIVNEKRLRLVEDNSTAEAPQRPKKTSKISAKSKDFNAAEDVNKTPAIDSPAQLSEDGSELRYKFPSPEPTVSKSKETVKKHNKSREVKLRASKAKLTQTVRRNVKKYFKSFNSSLDSTDNMQDYQDSDCSPITLPLRRSKLSLPTHCQQRRKSRNRKRSLPNIYILANNYSDNELPNKQVVTQNSNSTFKSDEGGFIINPERLHMLKNLSPASQTMEVHNDEVELDNTSSVSLPASPALSIVESISFSKQVLECMEECATISDSVASSANTDSNVQHMSIVSQEFNVNNPLMDQQFNMVKTSRKSQGQQKYSQTPLESYKSELTTNTSNILVNDSVNNTPSEALNKKMCNMIIDSAKKQNNNEYDYSTENSKKILARTCSTPHRKRKTIKSKALAVDGVIDECMEYCARNKTRLSCPPSIINFEGQSEPKSQDTSDEDIHNNVGRRKKRDIIKVKILRPSNKKRTDSNSNLQKNLNTVTLSDSCVNDSDAGNLVHGFNDSVDMIHNHTDTCINVNDCYQDTTCPPVECDSKPTTLSLSPLKCTMNEVPNKITLNRHNSDSSDTIIVKQELSDFGSPNSLITEDLSYDILPELPAYDWCQEENTDDILINSPRRNVNNQYMEQLFPLVCAVPDLSTITEASRDVPIHHDNSNKKVAGTTNVNVEDTRDCFYSCTSQDT